MPTWGMLWSGAIGSFTAAVIGGLVALLVVRLTNKNQARLAAEAREKAAIADFVAAADRLITEYEQGRQAIESLLHAMIAASVRWQLELKDRKMSSLLVDLPHRLANRAMDAYTTKERHDSPEFDKLLNAVVDVRFIALGWQDADPKERAAHRDELAGIARRTQQ